MDNSLKTCSHTELDDSDVYDASGGFTVDEADLSPDETNVLRVRRTTGGETGYSSTVSVGYDTTVTPSSANQTRSLSVTRTGGALEIRWELLTPNGKPTRVLFRRASDGVTYVVTPFALQPGTELFTLDSQALSGSCGAFGTQQQNTDGTYTDSSMWLDSGFGSLRVATDETGWAGPADRIDYYPFGLRLGADYATQASRRHYTGHERDINTGLDYMKARYSTATLARFQSVDPIRGKPASPQSWNRFAYVRNNPMHFVDPTGMQEQPPVLPIEGEQQLEDDAETLQAHSRAMLDEATDSRGSQSGYTPAPPELIGTRDYYIFRYENAPESYRNATGPEYYRDFGLRKFDDFQRLREGASPELQGFIDRAGVELQVRLERALSRNPGLELSRAPLLDAAFDTHSDAYAAAGFRDLSLADQFRVGQTAGVGDLFGAGIGPGFREIWQVYTTPAP